MWLPRVLLQRLQQKWRQQFLLFPHPSAKVIVNGYKQIAGQYADTVWLGVGLHIGYGNAQRMCIERGYIPDGTGVWDQDKPCEQYETEIDNADDLVLFLSNKLNGGHFRTVTLALIFVHSLQVKIEIS